MKMIDLRTPARDVKIPRSFMGYPPKHGFVMRASGLAFGWRWAFHRRAAIIRSRIEHDFHRVFDDNPYGASEWYNECTRCGVLCNAYEEPMPEQTCWEYQNKC